MIGITLTGADERTRISDLVRLRMMGAEIGLLLTHSPDGRNRYPSLGWIWEAATELQGHAALHVCGQRARQTLFEGGYKNLLKWFGRIQVNGDPSPGAIKDLCQRYDTKVVITQYPLNDSTLEMDDIYCNHALLVDGSGGRGISPEKWERPATSKLVGFAGGLGPENLATELPKIAAVADDEGDWWVDMEGNLRDNDDLFNVSRAEKALAVFLKWREENQ